MLTKEIIAKHIISRGLAPHAAVADHHADVVLCSWIGAVWVTSVVPMVLDASPLVGIASMATGYMTIVPLTRVNFKVRREPWCRRKWYGPVIIEHEGKVYNVTYCASVERTDCVNVHDYRCIKE